MSTHGYEFELISDKYTEALSEKSVCTGCKHYAVKPSNCIMPESYIQYCDRILDFEVYPDDTWILTFPKSGTTWTQEMVWLLKNNLDYEKAKNNYLVDRVPFLEFEAILFNRGSSEVRQKSMEVSENLPRPRCIKSHLPIALLPRKLWTVKPKIVYVTRDPRDVAVSYYHHYRLLYKYQGTLEEFIEAFLNNRIKYTPFWKHVLDFADIEDKTHILHNKYEDMKKDLPGIIRKTAKFLEVDITEEQLEKLAEHLSFEKMKANHSVNYDHLVNKIRKEDRDDDLKFMRKGVAGGWKNLFSPELADKFKKWNEEHLKGRNLDEFLQS